MEKEKDCKGVIGLEHIGGCGLVSFGEDLGDCSTLIPIFSELFIACGQGLQRRGGNKTCEWWNV